MRETQRKNNRRAVVEWDKAKGGNGERVGIVAWEEAKNVSVRAVRIAQQSTLHIKGVVLE